MALVLLAVAFVAAGGVALIVTGRDDSSTNVQTAVVEAGEVVVTVTAPGQIRADTRVSLSARTSATITELPASEGTAVTPGDVVVRLDDADARAGVRQAQAARRQAQATLEVARARLEAATAALDAGEASLVEARLELERQQGLLATDDTSRRSVEAAQAALRRLQAQQRTDELQREADRANLAALEAAVDAADAGLERARQTLADTVITSPISGTVVKLNAEVGEVVVVGTMNQPGTVILEVADLSTLVCVAEVDESNVALVREGQQATVRAAAYGDTALAGVVRNVALARTSPTGATEQTGYFEAEIVLDVDDGERQGLVRRLSGLTADAEFRVRVTSASARVPSQAVVSRRVDALPQASREALAGAGAVAAVVFVVEEGVAGRVVRVVRVVPVTTGDSDARYTEVTSGLSAGDVVVVGPFVTLDTLSDGDAVRQE